MRKTISLFIILLLFSCLSTAYAANNMEYGDLQNTNKIGELKVPNGSDNLSVDKGTTATNIVSKIYTIPIAVLKAQSSEKGGIASKLRYYMDNIQVLGMYFILMMFFVGVILRYMNPTETQNLDLAELAVKLIVYEIFAYFLPFIVLSVFTGMYYLYGMTLSEIPFKDPTASIYKAIGDYFRILTGFLGAGNYHPANSAVSDVPWLDTLLHANSDLNPAILFVKLLTKFIIWSNAVPYLIITGVITIALTMISITLILFSIGILLSAIYSIILTVVFLPVFYGLDLIEMDKPLEHAAGNIMVPLFIPIILQFMMAIPISVLGITIKPYLDSLNAMLTLTDSFAKKDYFTIIGNSVEITNLTQALFIDNIIEIFISVSMLFVINSVIKSAPDIAQKIFGSSIAKLNMAGAGVFAGMVGTAAGITAGIATAGLGAGVANAASIGRDIAQGGGLANPVPPNIMNMAEKIGNSKIGFDSTKNEKGNVSMGANTAETGLNIPSQQNSGTKFDPKVENKDQSTNKQTTNAPDNSNTNLKNQSEGVLNNDKKNLEANKEDMKNKIDMKKAEGTDIQSQIETKKAEMSGIKTQMDKNDALINHSKLNKGDQQTRDAANKAKNEKPAMQYAIAQKQEEINALQTKSAGNKAETAQIQKDYAANNSQLGNVNNELTRRHENTQFKQGVGKFTGNVAHVAEMAVRGTGHASKSMLEGRHDEVANITNQKYSKIKAMGDKSQVAKNPTTKK